MSGAAAFSSAVFGVNVWQSVKKSHGLFGLRKKVVVVHFTKIKIQSIKKTLLVGYLDDFGTDIKTSNI